MAKYFAGGHLRFVNGEWRDDNGDAIEISRVRHERWTWNEEGEIGLGAVLQMLKLWRQGVLGK